MAGIVDHPVIIEMGKRLAQREALRREHNQWVNDVADGKKSAEQNRAYRTHRFDPLNMALCKRINTLTDSAGADVLGALKFPMLLPSGKIVMPPGITMLRDRLSVLWLARRHVLGEQIGMEDERAVAIRDATGNAKTELRAASVSDIALPAEWIGGTELPDPLVDFTGFTEVDSESAITLATNTVTISSMRRVADSYCYKDYGANHFADGLAHLIEIQRIAGADLNGWNGFWAVADTVGSYVDFRNGTIAFLVVSVGGQANYIIDRGSGADLASDFFEETGTLNNRYHTISRSGTTMTDAMRSTSHTGTLLDTLSITVQSASRRYMMTAFSRDDGSGTAQLGSYIRNLDLQEAAAFKPYWIPQRTRMIGATL